MFRDYLKVIRKYTTVELLMIFYVLPSYLLWIAIQNLALEKSCTVNFGYSDEVCKNMINKELNKINCVDVQEKRMSVNETHLIIEDVYNVTHFLNGTEIIVENNKTLFTDLKRLHVDACQAEIDSQSLETSLTAYIAPFESILGIIMILFGGNWSDKRHKRKPCMMIPLLGETGAVIVLIITSYFFKELPLQFHMILTKILPAACGGIYLFLMGVYSYLTETTEENDRTFRYNVFAQFVQILPIFALPFAGPLYNKLGYLNIFLICLPINLAGIFYIIFGMKEVENKPSMELKGVDNPTFTRPNETETNGGTRENELQNGHQPEVKSKGFLRDFFDPTVALQAARVILRKREYGAQAVIIFLIIIQFISVGIASGEGPNEYNFTRLKLNWEGNAYSLLSSYSSGVSFILTTLLVFLLSKVFGCSDPLMAIVSTTLSTIGRFFFIIATLGAHLYIAKTLDACTVIRGLVVRAVLAKYVESSEIGRTFSLLAVVESLCSFVFIDLYAYVYKKTLDTWPSAIFFLSLILLAIIDIFFIVLYFLVKKKDQRDELEAEQKKKIQAVENPSKFTGLNETTHL